MATSPNFNWPEPDNTDLVKNGALAIRTAVDAIDSSLVDLKGGTTGQVLSKASNTDMDFVWAADAGAPESYGFTAGKNKIINGDFGVWQRGTTFNSASSGNYFADRFTCFIGGGTQNITRQTFTPGTAPVAGYEGQYFLRWTAATAGNVALTQRIENVQTYAGQTVTLSFWAKANSAINISAGLYQNFGSGGSGTVSNLSGTTAITTSWARYFFTFNLASLTGKTIGTSSYLQADINLPNSTFVFDTWGWQLEVGSAPTAFQTATGTIQGELAACQRYYYRYTGSGYTSTPMGLGQSSTSANIPLPNPTTLRTVATSVEYTGAGVFSLNDSVNSITFTSASIDSGRSTPQVTWLALVVSGATAFRPYWLQAGNNSSAFIGISAEL